VLNSEEAVKLGCRELLQSLMKSNQAYSNEFSLVFSMKGVILAAGEGTRIRRVTYGAFPKELLPIGNVPTIRFPIEALKLAGVRDILVVIAPQTKHGIIDGLQSGERFGVHICYAVQEKTENAPARFRSITLE